MNLSIKSKYLKHLLAKFIEKKLKMEGLVIDIHQLDVRGDDGAFKADIAVHCELPYAQLEKLL